MGNGVDDDEDEAVDDDDDAAAEAPGFARAKTVPQDSFDCTACFFGCGPPPDDMQSRRR